MEKNILKNEQKEFLNHDVEVYYNRNYTGYGNKGNPDFLNIIKNQFGNGDIQLLKEAYDEVKKVFKIDIQELLEIKNGEEFVVICVPRSKATFTSEQQYFKKAISDVVDELNLHNITNGCDAVTRVKNPKTTHMHQNLDYFKNDGEAPYTGITKATCEFNQDKIFGKKIILVDDIYTSGVNVDEDCIEALYDYGAKEVLLYTIARTKYHNNL